MKKIFMLFFATILFLTSCSVSSVPVGNFTSSNTLPITKVESTLTSNDFILCGTTYTADEIQTETIEFGHTKAICPILPTEELNIALRSSIDAYISSLDLPFSPDYLDFYFTDAFLSRSYTFYPADTTVAFTLPKLHFSYNLKTLKQTEIYDYFYEKTFDEIIYELYDVSDLVVDSFDIKENGITVFAGNNEYFISGSYIDNDKTITVFHPEKYQPVVKGEKYVAITFDDGPNPYTTPGLVDMLDKKGVKATFFMVGYNIEEYPHIVKKVFVSGHDIGIHSFGHSDYSLMNGEDVIRDLDRCADLVYSIIAKRPYLVRPPFGNIDMKKISSDKYFFVNWNVDPLDWKYESAEKIAEEAIKYVKPGSIVLLHDIYQTSCDAASLIVDKLLEEGYRFVTISEYFDLNGNVTDNKLHFFTEDYNANKN